MQARRVGGDSLLVVLGRDEKVVASLLEVAAAEGIEGGWVSGLGSVKNAVLGYYDLPRRVYLRREFPEDVELTGLLGNLAMDGAERILHVHASLSGPELISFSGHLFEAEVAVTAEFLLRDLGERLERRNDPAVGLRLLDCGGGAAKDEPPVRPGKRRRSHR